jgi:hypothetical protein
MLVGGSSRSRMKRSNSKYRADEDSRELHDEKAAVFG